MSQPVQDASDIDWATVDLTTIDWATIDMSQVDFTALRDNPTAANLDDETTLLIGSRMNPGSATLVIGDQTWEFDSFLCAFGHGATQSDVYSFSSDTRGDHEGARVQVQANIRDESGQGRFEGEDLIHQVYIEDIDDFDNPSINFEFNAPEGISIEGDTLTAEGLFDNRPTAFVDGQEFNFEDLGPVTCTVDVGEFGFSFFIGDNEVTLGGGGFYSEDVGWGGSISMFVAGPPEEGQDGNSTYAVALPEVDESTLAFEENSMSYFGPLERQFYDPASEGGSGVEEVGTGTISVTCP